MALEAVELSLHVSARSALKLLLLPLPCRPQKKHTGWSMVKCTQMVFRHLCYRLVHQWLLRVSKMKRLKGNSLNLV